jgi:hypothetical protein
MADLLVPKNNKNWIHNGNYSVPNGSAISECTRISFYLFFFLLTRRRDAFWKTIHEIIDFQNNNKPM